MLLSQKQIDFVKNGNKRWNFKGGATRSGKTYLDFKWIIPMRIRERIGKDGLSVILGVTKSTIERNVLEPMRRVYGDVLVGTISSDNTAWIFGEKCYCLGAEKVSQVSKIRGASIKYCYGDEVADWSEEVFELLKSRLDKEYSCFDGTFNPKYPGHWLKKFLDSDSDIFSQTYCIDDNPFLPAEFVENLKREYQGTVFYDRYILGLWTRAEGLCYPEFADNIQKYKTDHPQYDFVQIGVDFGGNKSAHAFVATGIKRGQGICYLMSRRIEAQGVTPEKLYQHFDNFLRECKAKYPGQYGYTFADCAEQTLIAGMASRFPGIKNSLKNPIVDRIRATNALISLGKLSYTSDCKSLVDAMLTAVWDDTKLDDVRLDNGTSDIDTLDAAEYSWESYLYQLAQIKKG